MAYKGISKTTEKFKSQFHWMGMSTDVRSHIQKCPVCNRFKKSKRPKASLQNYTVGHPMARIALDIIGPLPRSKRHNQYILVIGDHFSRWMDAYPLPNQMTEKVAEKLVNEFIEGFGVPLEVHIDQGVILNLFPSKKCVHCLMLRKQGPHLIGPLPMDSLKNSI